MPAHLELIKTLLQQDHALRSHLASIAQIAPNHLKPVQLELISITTRMAAKHVLNSILVLVGVVHQWNVHKETIFYQMSVRLVLLTNHVKMLT